MYQRVSFAFLVWPPWTANLVIWSCAPPLE